MTSSKVAIVAVYLALGMVCLTVIAGCQSQEETMPTSRIEEFATSYTAAWCSQDPGRVAAHFAETGSLQINDGEPSVGRAEITEAAQSFMTALPDMVVAMDGITLDGNDAVYRWTLTGTNTGPGGTGNPVQVSGNEKWTLDANGLIAESKGHFDAVEYDRQLNAAPPGE